MPEQYDADFAPPLAHLAEQAPVSISGVSGIKNVQADGTTVNSATRGTLDVDAGTGITVTGVDSSGDDKVTLTVKNAMQDAVTAAGQIPYGTAADTVAWLDIGTAGQTLKVNAGATAPEWATVTSEYDVLTKVTTAVTVVNTVTETDLINYTIPAGTIGTNKKILISLGGEFVANAAGNCRLRVKLGGTTIYDTGAGTMAWLNNNDYASALRQPWEMELKITALGSASSQRLRGWVKSADLAVTGPTTGLGIMGGAASIVNEIASNGATAIDMASAQAVVVSVEWSAANASLEVKMFEADVAVIG